MKLEFILLANSNNTTTNPTGKLGGENSMSSLSLSKLMDNFELLKSSVKEEPASVLKLSIKTNSLY